MADMYQERVTPSLLALAATALNLALQEWAKGTKQTPALDFRREFFEGISHSNILPPDAVLTREINSAQYNKCLLYWDSIHPVPQRALLRERKKTINSQIELGMENDYAHVSKTDAMGTNVSNVDVLF